MNDEFDIVENIACVAREYVWVMHLAPCYDIIYDDIYVPIWAIKNNLQQSLWNSLRWNNIIEQDTIWVRYNFGIQLK
jgi:hypothetical protein